ncbi:MAG: hypothetical protein ABI689_10405 [Thermoanaerobaculia bacterium]
MTPAATSPASPAKAPRPVVFVHAGAAGEAPPRLATLAAALSGRGRSSRALAASELRGVRAAITVFVGDTAAGRLLRARLAGNCVVLDVRGRRAGPRLPGGARLVDGAIFRSLRQQKNLDRRRWTSRMICDEPEPGLAPHTVAAGEFQIACFGVSAAGEHFGSIRGVAFIASHPLRHAGQFNCHLSLRVPGPAELYQPGAEVANAAACGALLVTMRDAAAVELLGEDYPFYCAGDRASIEATIQRARQACGGPQWTAALALLREAGAKSTLEHVVDLHLEHFAALERATSAV